MSNAMDRLVNKIKEMNNPTVIGLDPRYDMLPNCIKEKYGIDVKSICEYKCRRTHKLLCSYYVKHKIKYSCIFRKKLNK